MNINIYDEKFVERRSEYGVAGKILIHIFY